MKAISLLLFATISVFLVENIQAQQTLIKGTVKNHEGREPLVDVQVVLEKTSLKTSTNAFGRFSFQGKNIPFGERVLKLQKKGFRTRRFQIIIDSMKILNMGVLTMKPKGGRENFKIARIDLSRQQIEGQRNSTSNLAGMLSASKSVFLEAAAYSFSAAFFSPRGYGASQEKVLINGIEMNKLYDGAPEWSSWGGLNDLQRNRTYTRGIKANDHIFGGLGGATNINMRASKYGEGGKVSYAFANRTYRGRVMASYSSGMLENGWAYAFLFSRRFGKEGYRQGTFYDANSFSLSVEKRLNSEHSINLTAFYTPVRCGTSATMTQEVYELKGRRYNPNWGFQNGKMRNSQVKSVREPVFLLNHYWDISENIRLNTNFAWQSSEISESRIDNGGTRVVKGPLGEIFYVGGARNPSPNYYKNLPSYYLREPTPSAGDYQKAFFARKNFMKNGQLNWRMLYRANKTRKDGNSVYILKEDVREEHKIAANSILYASLNPHVSINAALKYRNVRTENYARVKDLLGGQGFLDIDFYAEVAAEESGLTEVAQSDLNHPNRIVQKGDRYNYNYEIDAEVYESFAQAQFDYKEIDFFFAGKLSQTSYQRNGLYKNGYFPKNSFGGSPKLTFTNFGLKTGLNYKITGRHILSFHAGYFTEAPAIKESYSNPRQNNFPVIGLQSEKIHTVDLSYSYQSPWMMGRITGYYTGFQDGTEVGLFFTEGLAGLGLENDAAFVHEVLTGIDRRNIGIEFGLKIDLTPTISLKAAGAIGQYTYTNNPNLYLRSDDFEGILRFGDGKTKLKNYHVAGGPENALQLGFEYSKNYWWLGLSANYFSQAYIDISALRRSDNFVLAYDGLPLQNINPDKVHKLLRQEQFDDYMLFNLVGGKSWKIGDYYFGFFAVVNNIFNQVYKTGGFEQSRLSSYPDYKRDQTRKHGPIFGNKYFFGLGTTYYINFYVRF